MKRFAIFYFFVFICIHAWPQDVEKAFEYYNAGMYAEAADEFEALLPLLELEYGKNDTSVYAKYLIYTGAAFYESQQINEAEYYLLIARDVYQQNNATADDWYALLLEKLIVLNQHLGKYEKILPFYLETLEIIEITLGRQHSSYGVTLNDLAVLYKQMEQYDYALPLLCEALENTEKSLGKEHAWHGVILNNLAELYSQMGQYDKALPLFIEALENIEKSLGKEHSEYLERLNNLADLYISMGQYEKALSLYLEALTITEKNVGTEQSEYGVSLNNLANLYALIGEYENALFYYEEALLNTKQYLGIEHPDYGIVLSNLSGVYSKLGYYDKELILSIEAKDQIEKSLGIDHPSFSLSLNNLATSYENIGFYDQAASLYQEALDNIEKSLGKLHPNYGLVLNNFAVLYGKMGIYEESLSLIIEALEHTEKSAGKAHPDYGIRLNNIALIYCYMGQFDKALSSYLMVLENISSNLGKDHPNYGMCLNNLGQLYSKMGQYSNATATYQEALSNIEKTLGKDHPDFSICLNNLGLMYFQIAEYEVAIPLFLEALEQTENIFGKEHPNYITILNNLALLFEMFDQNDKALIIYLEVIEITDKILGKNHPDYSVRLNNLAGLYLKIGQHDLAKDLYLQALEVFEKSLGINHTDYRIYLNNLGIFYRQLNQNSNALPIFINAQNNIIQGFIKNFMFMTESEKFEYMETVYNNFESYQSFYSTYFIEEPDVSKPSYDITLATKGLILSSGINLRKVILQCEDEQIKTIFDEWLVMKHSINHLQNTPISQSSVDSLIHAANRLERELTRHSQEFGEMQVALRIKWEDVQKGLTENEVAIEFLSFKYHDGKRWTDSTFYCALVLTKDSEYPHMIFLFEENDLYEALPDPTHSSHWDYNLVYQGARASGTVFYEQETYRGDKLYELIWQPIDSLLQDKGTETIYFAPSGLLHTVSISAIPTPDEKLLMEKYRLVQLGSTRTLAMQQEAVELKTAVVFGGIDYDVKGEELELIAQQFKENESFAFQYMTYRASDTRYAGFTYLDGSLVEAKKVSALLNEKISTTKITGRDAVEESFKALSGSHAPSVIHIATHGFYFPDTISDKRREQMMFAAIGEERFRISDDPLMRSALVMAGANHAWQGKQLPPGVQDGILTARDVSAMNLANTELVVLSACQTGLGDVKGSEGVTGLQRAFKMAGVRYIIMSLWPVPDKETVEFMEAFYTHWLGGMEIRIAFNTTQKQMHAKYPNEPFKWAAFVLVE